MNRPHISAVVRQRVMEAARYRCGYCQTQQAVVGITLHIEHIIPLAAGGSSEEDNLWLACPTCNNHKGTQTQVIDPETGEATLLFNPRFQIWHEHFVWSADGVTIIGLTAVGRATLMALKMNEAPVQRARRRWVLAGWHPPQE